MSSIDGLTKISNHRTLIECLKAGIIDADRTNRPLSIAFFDLDDFKQVNDSKGHVCGDRVLVDVAAITRQSIWDTDIAGRYGGEEFMVVFSNADLVTASNAAERIRKPLKTWRFMMECQ
jgi:diguanylate cyclase (GGDEF)-like protein